MQMAMDEQKIEDLVRRQLKNFWEGGIEKFDLTKDIYRALSRVEKCFDRLNAKVFSRNGESFFSPYHTTSYAIFLYFLSNELSQHDKQAADLVYYLNKVMHSVDWYHEIELPDYFVAEHPVGSVLGRAKYSNYLSIYQGTTIGGSGKEGKLYYPELEENIILYSGSSLIGQSHIGHDVILSANCCVKNEDVPPCCIVFGSSPNLIIKKKSQEEIREMARTWKWG